MLWTYFGSLLQQTIKSQRCSPESSANITDLAVCLLLSAKVNIEMEEPAR